MGIICESCGRDIDALGQDNMSCTSEPLCEDCWSERQGRAAESLRREVRGLRFENARLREKLDARAEEAARPEATKFAADAVKDARLGIEAVYKVSRERALALTKLDECEMWLGRCEPKETAAPTLKGAAQDAAMPCLKDDIRVELKPEMVAETVAKSLRESMRPAMRMAVEQPWSSRRGQSAAPASRCAAPACGTRDVWHHLPKGGDRCRWCGHAFEDFAYRKAGPKAGGGAR